MPTKELIHDAESKDNTLWTFDDAKDAIDEKLKPYIEALAELGFETPEEV